MKEDKSINEIIKALGLKPLEAEGGYFKETYRSEEKIQKEKADLNGKIICTSKALCTSIIYLITRNSFSKLHRLPSAEIYNFLSGDPIIMINIGKDGSVRKVTMGNNFYKDELLQHIVPPECWQGAYLKDGGSFALLGTVVSPGFEYSDYESAFNYKEELLGSFPDLREILSKLF